MAGTYFKTAALALILVAGLAPGRSSQASTLTYDLTLSGDQIGGTFTVNDPSGSSSPSGALSVTSLSLDVGGTWYKFTSDVSNPFATFNNGALTSIEYLGSADKFKLDLGTLGLSYVFTDLLASNPISTGIISATATPLPSGLPLFISGLVALGFLGWRKKRMMQAA